MSTDEASSKKNPSPEAASCTLQGADYADYLLQAAKDKYLRVLHSGIENLAEVDIEIDIFTCAATLLFYDKKAKVTRVLTRGTLKLIFKSPRQFHTNYREGNDWNPDKLHVILNVATEGGNAQGYSIDFFKNMKFTHLLGSETATDMLVFNPIQRGEPVTMIIKTSSPEINKDLYEHLKQTTGMFNASK